MDPLPVLMFVRQFNAKLLAESQDVSVVIVIQGVAGMKFDHGLKIDSPDSLAVDRAGSVTVDNPVPQFSPFGSTS
jgi:hypothetical protein